MAKNLEGWLEKKGQDWSGLGLTTGFRTKKRWCVLDVKSRELSFYKDKCSEVRQGFVDLSTARRLESQPGTGDFDILTQQRVFELRANTEEDARRWMMAIQPHLRSRSSSIGSPISFAGQLSGSMIGMSDSAGMFETVIRNAAPWCVESVGLEDGDNNVPLDITAHLGRLPEDRSFDARVRLSDGTTYNVSSTNFDLAGGRRREIAATGDSKLFAQLVRAEGSSSSASKETARVNVVQEDVEVPPSVNSRTISLFAAASFCSGAALSAVLPSVVARRVGRRRLFALLLAAAGFILSRCWKDVRSSIRPRLMPSPPKKRKVEPPPVNSWNLVLRATTEMSKDDAEKKDRSFHNKTESFLMRAASSQSAGVSEAPPPGYVNFSGKWRLNLQRSSDPTEMLAALGVPWIIRKGLAGKSRTVDIHQDGFLWTDTTITVLITKTMTFSLDGVPYSEMSPVDRHMITMTSKFVEGGQAILTASTYSDGIRTQEVFRRLLDDGQTYHIHNLLTLGAGQVIESHSYFNRQS